MKKIYWGTAMCELGPPKLIEPTLTNLKKDLNSDNYYFDKTEPAKLDGWLTCPAATGILNNIYVFRSGIEIKIKFNSDGTLTVQFPSAKNKLLEKGGNAEMYHQIAETIRRKTVVIRNKKTKFVTLDMNGYFFSEDDIFAEQHHPWLENTDVSRNTSSVIGGFYINKWFRPIQPTFIMHNNELHIKPGDALYYVKFPANEKYKLIEFTANKKIVDHSSFGTAFKFFKAHSPMNFLYNLFIGKKLNKTLLKEIKNNII